MFPSVKVHLLTFCLYEVLPATRSTVDARSRAWAWPVLLLLLLSPSLSLSLSPLAHTHSRVVELMSEDHRPSLPLLHLDSHRRPGSSPLGSSEDARRHHSLLLSLARPVDLCALYLARTSTNLRSKIVKSSVLLIKRYQLYPYGSSLEPH